MTITVKKVALFLVACVLAGSLVSQLIENDPHHAEVISFVANNQQVAKRVGPIKALKVVGITSVQSGISRDNSRTPAYDLYRVNVRGQRASAQVTVERRSPQGGDSSGLRIRSFD